MTYTQLGKKEKMRCHEEVEEYVYKAFHHSGRLRTQTFRPFSFGVSTFMPNNAFRSSGDSLE